MNLSSKQNKAYSSAPPPFQKKEKEKKKGIGLITKKYYKFLRLENKYCKIKYIETHHFCFVEIISCN